VQPKAAGVLLEGVSWRLTREKPYFFKLLFGVNKIQFWKLINFGMELEGLEVGKRTYSLN